MSPFGVATHPLHNPPMWNGAVGFKPSSWPMLVAYVFLFCSCLVGGGWVGVFVVYAARSVARSVREVVVGLAFLFFALGAGGNAAHFSPVRFGGFRRDSCSDCHFIHAPWISFIFQLDFTHFPWSSFFHFSFPVQAWMSRNSRLGFP